MSVRTIKHRSRRSPQPERRSCFLLPRIALLAKMRSEALLSLGGTGRTHMAIVVECGCGKRFGAREELAGKTLACPSCGQALTVPSAAPATPPPAAAAPAPIVVTCGCGQRFAARAELAGKTLACPKCGQAITVPSAAAKSAPPKTAPPKTAPPKAPAPKAAPPQPAAPAAGVGDLLDEVGLMPTKTGVRCVKCRADMKPGTVICVQCGYNHETDTTLKTKKWT